MLPLSLLSRRFVVLAVGLALLVGMWPGVMTQPARAAVTTVFVNEFHYDNDGADTQEFIEVAGPAGTNLDNYDLFLYNGNGGGAYGSLALSGTLDDQQGGMGTASFDAQGLQNGSPDGIALILNGNVVVQFLSYEGSFTATSGPASGSVSTDIGISEPADTPANQSLQLTGTGTFYEDFTWSGPTAFTPGAPNTGQTFGEVENLPVTAICGAPLTVAQGSSAQRQVTGTDPDGTVVSLAINGTAVPGITIGATTPAADVGGTASATVSVADTTAVGTHQVEITASNDDAAPQTATCTLTVNVATGGVAPVVANCGTGALSLPQGYAGSRTVSASDADGTVVSLAITSTAVPGISIGATTPAGTVGGIASAAVTVAGTTAVGAYQLEITASNDDAVPQTGTCTLVVTVAPIRAIGDVQGSVGDTDDGPTHRSSFAPATGNSGGQQVFVRGVVTQLGRFPTAAGGQNWGFWLQSRVGDEDGDPNSSDGIFVFIGGFSTVLRLDGSTPAYQPAVGDEILLRGNVTEFFFLTELGGPRLVEVSDTGVDVTDPAEIETTEANPSDDLTDANRFWERHEGMRFHLDDGAHVVAARDGFPSTKDAELWVIRGDHAINQREDPYQRIVYRDPHPLDDLPATFDNGNGMRIMLQSHGLKGAANSNDPLVAPANTYDTVTNEVAGSLYFAFNKYGIEISEQLELQAGVDPAQNFAPAAPDPNAEFATSDYNVENLYDFRDDPFDGCDFTGNSGCPGVSPPFDFVPASEQAYRKHLADLAAQIAGPMHAPDLLMIQEAEDQDICTAGGAAMVCGNTNNRDGMPDTLQELALAISAAGGPTYLAVYDRDGADDRGIVSAFMYRTDTVELLPADEEDPVLGESPTVEYRGAAKAYNADVSNPKVLNADLPADVDLSTGVDGTNVYTRPPQVGHFRVWRDGIGLSVFTDLYAISNHFSSIPNARVGQRTEQAAYNAAIVLALAEADADRVVSAGDFNVFPRPDDPFGNPSDQLGPMYAAGLHNLWDTLVAEVPRSAYSYSFEGQAQTLDMQWATDSQFADLVQIRAAHLNADFAADFDGDVARGASDHDPQVARWFTDATFVRMHALVDYYVGTGDLPADKAYLFHNRLDKARAYVAQGKVGTARSQLQAFGNQAHDYAPAAVADAMAKEATRLAGLL